MELAPDHLLHRNDLWGAVRRCCRLEQRNGSRVRELLPLKLLLLLLLR